ncbi:VAN3-binding protein [Cynara cardunculus var. scolymus]|uniref:VAN3-binding protein n=1 Tax=Cynara cardunculus var. scolymus TaxID=59895 RepID=UPI000D623E0B|nr:VAN3-binding protein [Cynara cardunculus var. scolymus]
MDTAWQEQNHGGGGFQLPESPRKPMEFLSRSWSAAALQVSKTLHSPLSPLVPKSGLPNDTGANSVVAADNNRFSAAEAAEDSAAAALLSGNTFSFASSATSQLVLERIMSQSDISPLASGRLSHSSGPLNALTEETDSPPISPSDDYDDVVKYLRANNTLQPLFANARGGYGAGGSSTPAGKTVGRWLKERREKKKEETRAHNAQLHAAVSVAGVAAAVATIAAATAAASASRKDEQMAKTDMAVASAATLVAAQCVEAAEAMGAEREHLIAAVNSAVNVKSHGDILTLTAAAATALRGAATLKARALKEVWNIAAVIPVDRGVKENKNHGKSSSYCEELLPEENFLGICNQELLARGSELLKRTRNGDLHWKIVSVYIHRTGQVMLKMKSKHVGSTITKKKKNVVLEVCKNLPAWPGRHLFEGGEQRRYFGLRTTIRGVVEFECRNQREYDMWTQGISRLLSIVAEKKLGRQQ